MDKKCALIGYGIQGEAIAARLKDAGYLVSIFDIDQERMNLAARQGLQCANSFNNAVADTHYIMLTLTAGRAVQELLLDSTHLEILTSRQWIIQMGTSAVSDVLQINQILKAKNITFIEAILSGPDSAIRTGNCPLIVGADKKYIHALEQFLQPIGKVFYVGEIGKAAAFNLASLNILYALIQNFAISTALIECSHIDLDVWLKHVQSGFGLGPNNLFAMLTDYLWPVHFKNRNYQLMPPLQFKTNGAANETAAIQDFIKELGLNSILIQGMNEVQQAAMRANPTADWTALYDVLIPKE